MVPAQSAAAQSQMVGPQQYQHARERNSLWHEQSSQQWPAVPEQLLFEEQTRGGEGQKRRSGGLGLSRRRNPASRAGRLSEPAGGTRRRGASHGEGDSTGRHRR